MNLKDWIWLGLIIPIGLATSEETSSLGTFYPGTTTDVSSASSTLFASSNKADDEKPATSGIDVSETVSTEASVLKPEETAETGTVEDQGSTQGVTDQTGEKADEEVEASGSGDTSIVQNNYNVNGALQRISTPEALIYIIGTLLIMVLTLGLIVLSVILGRLLQKDDKPIMLTAPAGEIWRHDPIYEYPPGLAQGDAAPYKQQPLHVPEHND